jgi:hypothetical protein
MTTETRTTEICSGSGSRVEIIAVDHHPRTGARLPYGVCPGCRLEILVDYGNERVLPHRRPRADWVAEQAN